MAKPQWAQSSYQQSYYFFFRPLSEQIELTIENLVPFPLEQIHRFIVELFSAYVDSSVQKFFYKLTCNHVSH